MDPGNLPVSVASLTPGWAPLVNSTPADSRARRIAASFSGSPANLPVSKFETVFRWTPAAVARSLKDQFSAARAILTCAGFTSLHPCAKFTSDVSTSRCQSKTSTKYPHVARVHSSPLRPLDELKRILFWEVTRRAVDGQQRHRDKRPLFGSRFKIARIGVIRQAETHPRFPRAPRCCARCCAMND